MESGFGAAIFDMDGVVTRTAGLHAAAWKALFDELLREREGSRFRPFDERADYLAYVDGKPRQAGVESFLRARGIAASEAEKARLADRKDGLFELALREHGVETFPSTLALIRKLRGRGVKIGVVTSSRHGRDILHRAGISRSFDARLDGIDLTELRLKGKPDPDMFLRCARALGVPPGRTLVFEDAVAGVEAGRRGGFGLVVGVDRGGNASALAEAGADVVVADLGELDRDRLEAAFRARQETLSWQVEAEGFDAAREHTMESLFTVGNGYLGVRGALDSPLPGSQCDLFIAGIYDRKRADLPYSEIEFLAPGRDDLYAELVPLPSPFRMVARVNGVPLDFGGPDLRALSRRLELRRGVLRTEARFATPAGAPASLRSLRCACAHDPHLLLHEIELSPAGDIDASLRDGELAVRHPHLEQLEHRAQGDVELVRYATRASRFEICIAARSFAHAGRLRRCIAIFTSRDGPEPRTAAVNRLRSMEAKSLESELLNHEAKWREFWGAADIRIDDRPSVEQALRFAAYHLRIAADDDPRVSVGARALTGRAYEGHVFWDTEIFMLPFYLHTAPAAARSLLRYRHRTLDSARARARELGYRGACFAWESTVTGEDVTPTQIRLRSSGKQIPIFTGAQQVHVTADVAYAVWRYCEATGDEDFLAGPGAQILFETARFWASRLTREGSTYHLRGVVGPDEYHHNVDDNAYTNWMVRFNLERAAWAAEHYARNSAEAQEWRGIAGALHCPQPGPAGVIEQFAGFFELGEYALAREERMKAPVSRLFDWEKINRLKVVKQADVLMLPLVFPDAFPDDVVAANYRYYEPLTDHGSSLSPAVHAAIAARLGLREEAERYFGRALWLDLSNAMDNSALGIHPASMGGTWQALVFGFLGVTFANPGPRCDPRAVERLPEGWRSVALRLAWRGRMHEVHVERAEATV